MRIFGEGGHDLHIGLGRRIGAVDDSERCFAAAEPNVKIVATFPEDSHPPIIYPAALAKESSNADAKAFLDFLRSAKARAAFEKQGFTVLVKSASST